MEKCCKRDNYSLKSFQLCKGSGGFAGGLFETIPTEKDGIKIGIRFRVRD
jgi:hypothetical protein